MPSKSFLNMLKLRITGQGLRTGLWLPLCCVIATLFPSPQAHGQEQFQGVCAGVKIVILQQLTLERIGFEATLQISNNDGTDPLTDFSAALTFENPAFSTNGVNDSSSLFFVQAPTFQSVNSISGDGVIAPTTTAIVRWFIIPKISAGGTSPAGVRYNVGCKLSAKLRGVALPADVLLAHPAPIYVRPEPQLQITYFQPRDVQGDDPFTPEVESPIPFTLGVLVKNVGYGTAKAININSQQPKIVENKTALLLVAQLLGTRVNDSALDNANLNINLGDIPPGQARKGAWDMLCSLSGSFIAFSASYTHASDLGGQETSDIQSINAYFIAHEVLDDQPGRDGVKDFLADTATNHSTVIPNAIFESEGDILPVNLLTNAATEGSAGPGGSFPLTLSANIPGWGFIQVNDPGQAKLRIATVVRSDGKVLNTNNYWTSIRYDPITNAKLTFLNVLDLVSINNYIYDVTYAPSVADTTPPVTTMRFAGSINQNGGEYYVTPDTQIYFTAEDQSPVSIFVSVTNGPFLPALPFSLTQPGIYPIAFYSVDTSNNKEVIQTNLVVISGNGALDFTSVAVPGTPLFVAGDALSVRPINAPITFQAQFDPSQVNATIDIFQGVIGWATVSGTPSSPTADTSAILLVGGDYVDFYKYQFNGGAWSAERAVATPVSLSGLTAGTVSVSVLGRSQYGSYLDASNAVIVNWVVDPTSPATRITGAPASPTRSRTATLTIGGTGITDYRWTTNNGYYRVGTNVATPLPVIVNNASAQPVIVQILGGTNSVTQRTNVPTTAMWLFDPLFGFTQPGLPRVRSLTLTNVGSAPQSFVWDGHADTGSVMPPGWYTARITMIDQLSRTNSASRLIQIGDLAGSPAAIAGITRGPKNSYARGHWAVWEDQSDGNWEIYAQDVSTNGNAILKLTNVPLSQENPKTDGRFVVWQSRQPNGNWDVSVADLNNPGTITNVSRSFSLDEVNPTIEWPWVVCQTRASGSTTAPWQLTAYNLSSGTSFPVSTSTQDQLDPDVQGGRVVWQDFRDVGPGEIYLRDLESTLLRRITTNSFGQYHPVINNNWIVWQDGRNIEVDLYGFDLARNTEIQITSTPENETRPFIDGPWLACLEDSLGALTQNIRLIHLPTRGAVPLTRSLTLKANPALSSGKAIWQDTVTNLSSILAAPTPALQAVFQNRNAVAVTPAMVAYQQNAYSLLRLWNTQAGVQSITHYVSLIPQVVTETVYLTNGTPIGPNFPLAAGSFLWMAFANPTVLDLGLDNANPINLSVGVNVFSYSHFPSEYSAYKMLKQVGLNNARAIRMLDSESGLWVVAEVQGGALQGEDFPIPGTAMLMIDVASPVANFSPQ